MLDRIHLTAILQERLVLNAGDKEFINKILSTEIDDQFLSMALVNYFSRSKPDVNLVDQALKLARRDQAFRSGPLKLSCF